MWTGDSVESDSPYLIEQLRHRLLSSRGIVADHDEILITLGAQNALAVLGTLFAQFGQPIAVEDPGFFGAFNAFKMAGNQLIGVPIDHEGIIPAKIPGNVQLVFTTPSHQFPTMVTMPSAAGGNFWTPPRRRISWLSRTTMRRNELSGPLVPVAARYGP